MCSSRQRDLISIILWVGVSLSTSPRQHVVLAFFFASISPSPSFIPAISTRHISHMTGVYCASMRTVVFTGRFWARKLDYHHCCWPQCEWNRPRNKAGTIGDHVSYWHTTAHAASERWPYRHEAQREYRRAGGRGHKNTNKACRQAANWSVLKYDTLDRNIWDMDAGRKKEAKGWGRGNRATWRVTEMWLGVTAVTEVGKQMNRDRC